MKKLRKAGDEIFEQYSVKEGCTSTLSPEAFNGELEARLIEFSQFLKANAASGIMCVCHPDSTDTFSFCIGSLTTVRDLINYSTRTVDECEQRLGIMSGPVQGGMQ